MNSLASLLHAAAAAEATDAVEFVKPSLDYLALSPLLVVLGGAFLGVLLEAFLPRRRRFEIQAVFTAVVLLVALGLTVFLAVDGRAPGVTAMGSVVVDGATLYLWGLLLVLALAGGALMAERRLGGGVSAFAAQAAVPPHREASQPAERASWEQSEIFALFTFAVGGMLLFVAAADLLVLFVALEILSLPLYLLAATARRRRLLSQEAALKYFLLGAFASAFFLYGVALLYGYAGSTSLAALGEAVLAGESDVILLVAGTGMLLVGLLFKIGAAPFHAWTPDVYQGAPLPLTAFMAAATKVAAVGALVRVVAVALDRMPDAWAPVVWVVAVASMVLGTVLALTQDDLKRLLAYSSVAHAGFVLVGVMGLSSVESGPGTGSVILFYLTTYAVATLGAFALVGCVRDANGEAASLRRWSGLGRTSPWVAGAFAFLMLALAGIPLTSGFIGKFLVFSTAAEAGAWWLVGLAIAASVVAVAFYVRVVGVLFFGNAPAEADSVHVVRPSMPVVLVIAVAAVVTLAVGVVPDPLLNMASSAGEWLG